VGTAEERAATPVGSAVAVRLVEATTAAAAAAAMVAEGTAAAAKVVVAAAEAAGTMAAVVMVQRTVRSHLAVLPPCMCGM